MADGARKFYVYVIFRMNGAPCYVGKGSGRRTEYTCARTPNLHLKRIYQAANGKLPIVRVREGITEREAFDTERALIAAIGRKAHGGPLVNLTDGGEGVSGLVWTPEMRAAKAIGVARRWLDPDYREKMARANIGSKHNLGRKHTPEAKAARAERMAGNAFAKGSRRTSDQLDRARAVRADPEKRAIIAQKVKALWNDPVYRKCQMLSRNASEAYRSRASRRDYGAKK